MADYNEFCIVAEEQCVCVQKPQLNQEGSYLGSRSGSVTVKDDIVIRFGTWEFTIKRKDLCSIGIKNINKLPMVAEVVAWQWDQENKHQQKEIDTILFNENRSECYIYASLQCDVHFIIRILGKRKSVKDVCRPFVSEDVLTISVGDQTFVVSAKNLMKRSPVFRRMLTVEMREKAERKVVIEEADPEHFRVLLEVSNPRKNVQPNPTNVVGVLVLADRYQVNLAKNRCEAHLVNCVEMSLFERLKLAKTYGLTKLKESILSIGSERLRTFYKANLDELKKEGQFDEDLLDELHLRLCDDE